MYEEQTQASTTWLDLRTATTNEQEQISKQYAIPPEFLAYALDRDESARIERDEEAKTTLIIYDIPYEDESDVAHYSSGPMAFIVKKEVIMTNISHEKMTPEFEQMKRLISEDPTHKTAFVLNWMLQVSKRYVDTIRQLNRRRIAVEQLLGTNPKNEDLLQLMKIERSLIYFSMSLESNYLVIKKIRSGKYLKLYEEDKELLDDLVIEIEQAMDMAELSNRILTKLSDSYYTIISNSTNTVMKFLTIYSIILTIPTMIFSFYGMNVPLPFPHKGATAWVVIIAGSAILSVLLGYIFLKRDHLTPKISTNEKRKRYGKN